MSGWTWSGRIGFRAIDVHRFDPRENLIGRDGVSQDLKSYHAGHIVIEAHTFPSGESGGSVANRAATFIRSARLFNGLLISTLLLAFELLSNPYQLDEEDRMDLSRDDRFAGD